MDEELEWYVSSLYSEEQADELSWAFAADAALVRSEMLAALRDYMKTPKPKLGASMVRLRVSNLEENGEAVCMLVFLSLEKGHELPSQQAVFIGPRSYVYAKGKDIASQFEAFMQERGQDGDIVFKQIE